MPAPAPERLADGDHLAEPAAVGDFVADVVLVETNQWWVGYHRARSAPSRWPGGIMALRPPTDTVSRAWLKMEEALAWSQLPATPRRAVRGTRQLAGRRKPGAAVARI